MEQTKQTGYPSIDKPWLKYYSEEAINAPLPECTIYEYIWQNNKKHLDDVALIYFGRKITYRKLFREVQRTRDAFLQYGIRKGDKVILFTSSTPETVYAILALCRIGAVANMINPLFTEDQIVDRINETEASLMIILEQLYDLVADILHKTCVNKMIIVPIYNSMPRVKGKVAKYKLKNKRISYGIDLVSWNAFINNAHSDLPDAPYENNSPIIMVYSSGSTGASKGIVLTNTGITATIRHYINPDFPYQRGFTFLQMIPVWFSTGVVLSVLMPICLGITVILEPAFSKENFAKDLKAYNPHMTLTATSLWIHVMKTYMNSRLDLSNMKYPATGGELILPRVENALNVFLRQHGSRAPLLTAYGMCELGSTITTDSDTYHRIGASGYPMLGVIVAAFDTKTDREQPYYCRGEIRVNSPARMKEYFKNPQATAAFFKTDEQGRVWGCTGDIGYVDEDGFVFIKGRAADSCVVNSGETVYLFDVEDVILKDESVAQCKVVDIATEKGTELAAHIVFSEAVSDPEVKLKEIAANLKRELPPHMVPQYYKTRLSIPVHANGKRDVEAMRQDRNELIHF